MYVYVSLSECPHSGLESELCVYNYCYWYMHTNNPIHVQVKVCFLHAFTIACVRMHMCFAIDHV